MDDHCHTLEVIDSNEPIVTEDNEDDTDVNGQHIKHQIKQEMVNEEPINNDVETESVTESPRPQPTRAPVERLSPSSGEGSFTTGKSHANAKMRLVTSKPSSRLKKPFCAFAPDNLRRNLSFVPKAQNKITSRKATYKWQSKKSFSKIALKYLHPRIASFANLQLITLCINKNSNN